MELCLVKEHGYDIDPENAHDVVRVLLYCRTTMDSRLMK